MNKKRAVRANRRKQILIAALNRKIAWRDKQIAELKYLLAEARGIEAAAEIVVEFERKAARIPWAEQ